MDGVTPLFTYGIVGSTLGTSHRIWCGVPSGWAGDAIGALREGPFRRGNRWSVAGDASRRSSCAVVGTGRWVGSSDGIW